MWNFACVSSVDYALTVQINKKQIKQTSAVLIYQTKYKVKDIFVNTKVAKIWGSHGSEYEGYCRLVCDAV
jgi:hypothetical protein